MGAIETAFYGLKSRAQAIDVMANNLANLNVTGFKKDMVYYNLANEVAKHSSSELESVLGDYLVSERTVIDFGIGELVQTGNPLDLALSQEGFFVVETPEGLRYTRDGNFRLNEQRDLVTFEGFQVLGESGTISVPVGPLQISEEGMISVDGVSSGRLKVVHFEDLSLLKKAGASRFVAPKEARQRPPEGLTVYQGYLEQANVNPVAAVADMIALMRSFETLSQVIRSLLEQVDDQVIQEVGRV